MDICRIVEKTPTPTEYNYLRESVGWGVYGEEVIAAALPHSLLCLCAYQGGKLVGMARVVGDGGLVYYIQDVIVVPALQRQGIGNHLMERVMAYIAAHASRNSVVGLMSAGGKEAFYAHYGFTARPSGRLGAGMTISWQPDESFDGRLSSEEANFEHGSRRIGWTDQDLSAPDNQSPE